MTEIPRPDERLVLRGTLVTVIRATPIPAGIELIVALPGGGLDRMTATEDEIRSGRLVLSGRRASPRRTLAALYGFWMRSAAEQMRSGALATKPIRPFAHQDEAVDRMIAQPVLRFLLGDEPGTGKTIMSGLYIVEARRKLLVQGKVLVVAPAHLIAKWERELLAFFGIRAGVVTSELGRELRPLRDDVDTWLVSLDLFSHNSDVRSKLAGPTASWSLVVFDEAHRLTPTSQHLAAAQQISERTRHLLLLTATPHRGKEDFFRELMHLLDPASYSTATERPCIPSSVSFLRRMKEDLKDQDGKPLFPVRVSETVETRLRVDEHSIYDDVMEYVGQFYPHALTIARIVYGKRTASSAAALRATLERRKGMVRGVRTERGRDTFDQRFLAAIEGRLPEAGLLEDDDRWREAEDVVVAAPTVNKQAELQAIDQILTTLSQVELSGSPSKWHRLMETAAKHGITPGNDQLLVFTEFTDTATWLKDQFVQAGFTADLLYGGVSHGDRDVLQQRFLDGSFQVLVSTDAGGEGIDLQSANVLFNWDIPWSMVKLEQRMGRLHRIGQTRPVFVYHLVSPDTAEGRVQEVMLNNIAMAGESLKGRMYDLMDATAARLGFDFAALLAKAAAGLADSSSVPTVSEWERAAGDVVEASTRLTQQTNLELAQKRLRDDELEQINPVHVRRFLETVADWQGWAVKPGPFEGIHLVDASPQGLPDFLGGARTRLVATHGQPVADAIRHGAAGLKNEVVVFGPTEPAFSKLAEFAIREGLLDLTAGDPPHLVDTESYTPYFLAVYETTITAETDVGRVPRTLPFLVRLAGPGEAVIPEWASVLRLRAAAGSEAQRPLSPAGTATLHEAAEAHTESLTTERRKLREKWVQETILAMQDSFLRFSQEVADRPDDERSSLLAGYEDRIHRRSTELERMLQVDASPPALLGTIPISAGLTVDDPSLRENGEKVAVGEVLKELERLGFEIHDMQTAGVGYDLKGTNHPSLPPRCVEVKSLLDDLDAITLEQSEWTQAQQLGDAFWLYVVTDCRSGSVPHIAVRMQNPAEILTGPMAHQRFRVNVSQLRPHLEEL